MWLTSETWSPAQRLRWQQAALAGIDDEVDFKWASKRDDNHQLSVEDDWRKEHEKQKAFRAIKDLWDPLEAADHKKLYDTWLEDNPCPFKKATY